MLWLLCLCFLLWSLGTSRVWGCCFGTVTVLADRTLTCMCPRMLGAVVWLSSASPCSRTVFFCKHPWLGQSLQRGAA